MYIRNMSGILTLTATWVICAKCGKGFIGDETLITCHGCKTKERNIIRNNILNTWDWITITAIPTFSTMYCILENVLR